MELLMIPLYHLPIAEAIILIRVVAIVLGTSIICGKFEIILWEPIVEIFKTWR